MTGPARSVCAAILGVAAAVLASLPAHAALQVCDQTSYVIYAAIGYQERTDAVTKGWTRIVPGSCANVLSVPLTAPAYYLYAKSSQAHSGPSRVWGGKIRLCAKNTDFSLRQPLLMESCPGDSFVMPFSRVESGKKKSWSTTLTESKVITTLDMARQAGIARLLIDCGYKIGDAKSAESALADFRRRMKLSAKASTADLFDALETEAAKAAAPAGYSVCNDSDGEIFAAIGMGNGKIWSSRGWWKVAPASCARVVTAPLAADRIFLLVQRENGKPLVSGNAKFCVADVEYETAWRTDCHAHGLSDAGFAVTETRGRSGYAAHVGNSGLLPQGSHIPK